MSRPARDPDLERARLMYASGRYTLAQLSIAVGVSIDRLKKASRAGAWSADRSAVVPDPVRIELPTEGEALSSEIAGRIREALDSGRTGARDLIALHEWAKAQEAKPARRADLSGATDAELIALEGLIADIEGRELPPEAYQDRETGFRRALGAMALDLASARAAVAAPDAALRADLDQARRDLAQARQDVTIARLERDQEASRTRGLEALLAGRAEP